MGKQNVLPFLPELSLVDVRHVESGAVETSRYPLWLALYFPKLALEIFQYNQETEAAVAIERQQGRHIVRAASKCAELAGITPYMTLGASVALCPNLKVYDCDAYKQQQRLEELADWAHKFTSKVSIHAPQCLLLEVRGSIKLFGGLEQLHNHIIRTLKNQWPHVFFDAITPAPTASLVLATSAQFTSIEKTVVEKIDELRSILGALPVTSLPLKKNSN